MGIANSTSEPVKPQYFDEFCANRARCPISRSSSPRSGQFSMLNYASDLLLSQVSLLFNSIIVVARSLTIASAVSPYENFGIAPGIQTSLILVPRYE